MTLILRVAQKDSDVLSNVGLVDLVRFAAMSLRVPTRDAARVEDQPELFTCGFDSDMFDVGASQPASADKTITRRTRPAYFNQKHPHAVSQTQATTYHGGIPHLKAVTIIPRDLNAGAGAVCFACNQSKHLLQPITSG